MKLQFILKSCMATILLAVVVTACDSSKKQDDSAEIAKEQNDAVLEDRDDEKDADFIVNTIASNYAEIKLAQLAGTRSSDTGIKDMATLLEKDHSALIRQFQGYAAQKGISVPLEETADDKKEITNLSEEKEAKDFDKKWCSALEDRHQKSINNFEKRLDKTEDVELKNLISNTLPALRAHLAMLKENENKHN